MRELTGPERLAIIDERDQQIEQALALVVSINAQTTTLMGLEVNTLDPDTRATIRRLRTAALLTLSQLTKEKFCRYSPPRVGP